MSESLVDLQARLSFEQALKCDTPSSELFDRARQYESFGWPNAAEGTRQAALRLELVEQKTVDNT